MKPNKLLYKLGLAKSIGTRQRLTVKSVCSKSRSAPSTTTLTPIACSSRRAEATLPRKIVWRRNVLAIGATQFGKSTGILSEITGPAIVNGKVSVIVLDPDGSFGQLVGEFALGKGQGFRLVYVDLNDLDYTFSFGFAERPDRSLPPRHFRQQAMEQARMLADIMVAQRGSEYGTLDGKVMVKKGAIFAIGFWMHQREDVPLTYLPYALKPGTNEFDYLLNNCTDKTVKEEALQIARLWSRSATEFYKNFAPAERLIGELFEDELFKNMAEATADLERVIRNKGIIIFKGGTNPNTTRVLMRAVWQRVVYVLKRNWSLTGVPLPVLVQADEAHRLIGEPEARSTAETLKMMTDPETGEGGFTIISQTPNFGDDLVNMIISQNCTLKYFFHCGGLVAPLAAAELKAGIDPNLVKRIKTRMEHTGQFNEITTRSKGKSKDHEGHEREDVRDGTSFQPVYREVEDEELWALNDQGTLKEIALQQLNVGECWVRNGPEIFFKKIDKLKDPWAFTGLGKAMLAEHVRMQKEMGVFQEVIDLPPPLTPSPALPPAPAKTPRKKKGMG